jgi:hypothetical protein
VATHKTQGKRKNDFAWCEEGEPVGFSLECDGEKIDGKCGCRRSFSGMQSRKATTTAKVVESGMTELDYCTMFGISEQKAWGKDTFTAEELVAGAKELLEIAAVFAVGDIVEKRGSKIQVRDVS